LELYYLTGFYPLPSLHETPEQFLKSINRIGCPAQGSHATDLIAQLVEKAYLMRVDDRIARAQDQEATSHRRTPADNVGPNRLHAEH
jgi:hypothetical protein